jgi:hypothetical protein
LKNYLKVKKWHQINGDVYNGSVVVLKKENNLEVDTKIRLRDVLYILSDKWSSGARGIGMLSGGQKE